MLTNAQVISKFENEVEGKSKNLTSRGGRLFSYQTVVAQWINGKIVKNNTKYSRTTSKQITHLHYHAITTKPVPFEAQNLKDYYAEEK